MNQKIRRWIARSVSGELKEIRSDIFKRLGIAPRGTDLMASAVAVGVHPIDAAYGLDTGGTMDWQQIGGDRKSALYVTSFTSSQPSIIRQAIRALGDLGGLTFVDLGSGKGRALVVASEFPFRKIIGVEMSPLLHAIATRNASIIAENHPDRPKIETVLSDVIDYCFPSEPLVVFMYHPFYRALMQRVVGKIEQSIRDRPRDLYVIYVNPKMAALFDRSALFAKYYDAAIPRDPSEAAHVNWATQRVTIWKARSPEVAYT